MTPTPNSRFQCPARTDMSSHFNHKFCFVVEEIFKLGNTTKSQCLGVCIEAQAHGKEAWISKRPTSDHQCSDWQWTLSYLVPQSIHRSMRQSLLNQVSIK